MLQVGQIWPKPYVSWGFRQNFSKTLNLQKMFELTENKLLLEACYEKLWGTGIPLHHPHCLDHSLWTNHGVMSEMLGEIRDELNGIKGENTLDSGSEMELETEVNLK